MARPFLVFTILGSLAVACVGSDPGDAELEADSGQFKASPRSFCTNSYARVPTDIGIVDDPLLVEASGIVASLAQDDVIWMHNDSGDAARLYAIGTDASSKGRVRLAEAFFVDIEDIATGLCPDRQAPCLYVADTGDNHHNRANIAIFIVDEPPAEDLSTDAEFLTDRYIRVPVTYLGGPVNVEAIVVHPSEPALLLFEKVDKDGARVYEIRGPFKDGQSVEATELFAMPPVGVGALRNGRMITGADLHPSGQRLAIRTYTGIYELRIGEGKAWTAFDSAKPLLVALGPFSEPQGEAIAYAASGEALITISEDPERRRPQMLHHYPCETVDATVAERSP